MAVSQQRTGMQFLRAHGESSLAMFGVFVALFLAPFELGPGFTVTFYCNRVGWIDVEIYCD